jgi:hypothetical protein
MSRRGRRKREAESAAVPLIRRTGFWTGLAAALGLAATLWATLVGQTVPQLLTTENDVRADFRSDVEAVCGEIQTWTDARAENSYAGLVGRWPWRENAEHPGVPAIYRAEAAWTRLAAPKVYTREYDEFRRGWTAAFGAMYFDFPGRNALTFALARWRVAQRLAKDGLDRDGKRRGLAKRKVSDAVFEIDRDLNGVIVTSIAMSLPTCRRAADDLREAVEEEEPA